ncbi:hypothetical protein Q7506_08800 [Glaesserella parasuis]|uniref:hypothetical protein n=1 Tax=Glaesserella parasuis TaxID=738 RepID=UPI0027214964|nr:hypothetical protein [Glaesserella parasuis]
MKKTVFFGVLLIPSIMSASELKISSYTCKTDHGLECIEGDNKDYIIPNNAFRVFVDENTNPPSLKFLNRGSEIKIHSIIVNEKQCKSDFKRYAGNSNLYIGGSWPTKEINLMLSPNCLFKTLKVSLTDHYYDKYTIIYSK